MTELVEHGPPRDDPDALSAYWDILVGGHHPGDERHAGSLATVASHLHAVDATPRLGATERARIWDEVLDNAHVSEELTGSVGNGRADRGGSPLTALPTPWPVSQRRARRGSRPARLVAQLATAALLLVTIALGFLVFGNRNRVGDPPRIPAIDVPQTLLAMTIPVDYFPPWETAAAQLARQTFPAGTSATWITPALRVEYVVSGTYAVRADGPSQVVRRGRAALEPVAAGAETELRAGDGLVTPAQTISEYRNAGPPAEIVTWTLFLNADRKSLYPTGWVSADGDTRTGLSPQAGPTALRLQRVVLAPDSAFAAPPDALQLSVVWTEEGDDAQTRFDLARTSDGGLRNLSDAPITVYVVTVVAAGTGSLMP
jgi:hypothetical protein